MEEGMEEMYETRLRVLLKRKVPRMYNTLYQHTVESIEEMVETLVEESMNEWWSAFGSLPPTHEERSYNCYTLFCEGYIEDAMLNIQERINVQADDVHQIRIKENVFGDLSLQAYLQANRLLKEAWETISVLPANAPLPPFKQLVEVDYIM